MIHTPWKLLSVAEFVDRYRQAQPNNHLSTKNVTLHSNIVWQKRTVQEFFAAFQWSPSNANADVKEPFGLGLSVQSYFNHFRWDAPIRTAVASAPDAPLEPQPSFDIQNFSDLF